MSILHQKHTKLDDKSAQAVLEKYNVSLAQLPKISKDDAAVSQDCVKGDIVKIERRSGEDSETYYRVVI